MAHGGLRGCPCERSSGRGLARRRTRFGGEEPVAQKSPHSSASDAKEWEPVVRDYRLISPGSSAGLATSLVLLGLLLFGWFGRFLLLLLLGRLGVLVGRSLTPILRRAAMPFVAAGFVGPGFVASGFAIFRSGRGTVCASVISNRLVPGRLISNCLTAIATRGASLLR